MYKIATVALILLGIASSVFSQCNPGCGEGLQCCDADSGAQCYDPASYSCPTGSDGPILCGNVNGHANEACGTQCYDPTAYSCSSNGLLCPSGFEACGQACYAPSSYSCCNSQLAAVGASCSSSSGVPVAWPTETLVISTGYSGLSCSGSVASIGGFVQGQCYEYGSTSMRTFTCTSSQVNFEACDQSCSQCTLESTTSTSVCSLTEKYSCGTLAEPTEGQTYEMQFSDPNCKNLYNVAVYNNVCATQNLHASIQVSCNSTTYISNSYDNQNCVPSANSAPYTQPIGVCITQGDESVFYGCGPISQ